MEKIKLSHQDRGFFRLVAEAASTNPFSQARPAIDRQIAGVLGAVEWRPLVPKVVAAVDARLAALDQPRRYRFQDFAGPDAEVMRYTYLFAVYHHHSATIDAFIVAQQQSLHR